MIWLFVLLRIVAGLLPKSTAVAPARFVPLIVTGVPPSTAPEAGVKPEGTVNPETTGGGT